MSDQTPLHDPLTDAFDSFRGDTLPAFSPPGADAVRTTVRRRQRNRSVAIAACAVVTLVGTGAALANLKPPADGLRPAPAPSSTATPTPTTTPSTTPSATPATSRGTGSSDLTKVDWRNQSIPIPASTGCPGGDVQFRNGTASVDGYEYALLPVAGIQTSYGDVDGDGQSDAVLRLSCGNGGDGQNHLIVIGSNGNRLRAIGSTGTEAFVFFTSHEVAGGEIVATVKEGLTDAPEPRTQTRRYKWDGTKILQVGGPARFDEVPQKIDVAGYDWLNATLDLPFSGATVRMEPNNQSCPRTRVTFNGGTASASGCTYDIQSADAIGDANGDGEKDILLSIGARQSGLRNTWLFAYTIRDGKPALLGFVTGGLLAHADANKPYEVETISWTYASGAFSVRQYTLVGEAYQTVERTFRLSGGKFVASKPSPNSRADVRP